MRRAGVERAEAYGGAFEKKSLHAAERDREENHQRRETFLAKIRATPAERLIFLDESGVTTSMTRLYARRPDGRRIHEATPGGRWKIMTIVGGMRQSGITAAMTIEEATDGDIFLAYVKQVLGPTLATGDVVVMDNLGAHKVRGVEELIQACGAEVLYLPPYSPDLNPIEKAWAKIKQRLRSQRPRTREALEHAIADAIARVTTEDAQAWFRLATVAL
ncbi:MAG: IS630 family transposase [Bryobacteraceae bacterium]